MSRRLPHPALIEFARKILRAAGLDKPAAQIAAESLVDADRHLVSSHGLIRLPIYVERIQRQMIDPRAVPEVTSKGARATVDGHNAIGAYVAMTALEAACEIAAEHGLATATAQHSNHCGTMGFYARRAAENGYFAVAISNAPVTMAYHGGRTPAVGTNPLAVAVPRPDSPPLVLDIASSAVARGKIIVADSQDQSIPPGWALDSEGRPTTVAAEALKGVMLPFGGPKGSGIAMVIDLLCGLLAGGPSGPDIGNMYEQWDRPQSVGHSFLVSDFTEVIAQHGRELEKYLDWIRTLSPNEGYEAVLLPGDIEQAAAESSDTEGVPISESTWTALTTLADSLDVDGLPTTD